MTVISAEELAERFILELELTPFDVHCNTERRTVLYCMNQATARAIYNKIAVMSDAEIEAVLAHPETYESPVYDDDLKGRQLIEDRLYWTVYYTVMQLVESPSDYELDRLMAYVV